MEAIILAGGLGTRLRQMVPSLPKPMAPVAGRPFLEILLKTLAKKGVVRAVISLGYMADVVTKYFGCCFAGIELVYEIETSPLGTGGAVRQSLTKCHNNHVFIFNGDTYLDIELHKLESQWQHNSEEIIVAREVPDTSRYGRLEIDHNRIIGFSEKGIQGQGLINAGCYVLPIGALNDFPLGKAFSLETDYFACKVKTKSIDLFITKGHFIDIGVPEDYARAQVELIEASI